MICQGCDRDQPSDSLFCGVCGTSFNTKPIRKDGTILIEITVERDIDGKLMCPYCDETDFEIGLEMIHCYNCEKTIPIKVIV